MVTIYGIKNCDTMKKAFAWLTENGVEYAFHDYKKDGITRAKLAKWAGLVGWKTLLNTKGTTWRKLTPEQQADLDHHKAVDLMAEFPSLIKRPVIDIGGQIIVGFDANIYTSFIPR